ncbi:MAG: GmrSD restriction endonuclease domain-containing protein [Saprospiraceae bacterium]
MQASEIKLQKVIEGQLQYVIPFFQRAYSWDKKEWRALWEDIVELCEAENLENILYRKAKKCHLTRPMLLQGGVKSCLLQLQTALRF